MLIECLSENSVFPNRETGRGHDFESDPPLGESPLDRAVQCVWGEQVVTEIWFPYTYRDRLNWIPTVLSTT